MAERDREGLICCVFIVPCQTIIKFSGLAQQNSPFMVVWALLTVPPELLEKGPPSIGNEETEVFKPGLRAPGIVFVVWVWSKQL